MVNYIADYRLCVAANETTGVSSSKELGLGESKVKTTAKVVVPAKPNNVGSTGHSDGTGLSSPKGALLGLASYDSDDEGDGDGKGLIPNLSSEIKVGAAHPKESKFLKNTKLTWFPRIYFLKEELIINFLSLLRSCMY